MSTTGFSLTKGLSLWSFCLILLVSSRKVSCCNVRRIATFLWVSADIFCTYVLAGELITLARLTSLDIVHSRDVHLENRSKRCAPKLVGLLSIFRADDWTIRCTSGSSDNSCPSMSSWTRSLFCKKWGSLSQMLSQRLSAFTDRVATSAGLRCVGTYFHWRASVALHFF